MTKNVLKSFESIHKHSVTASWGDWRVPLPVANAIATSCYSNGSYNPHHRRARIVQLYSPDGVSLYGHLKWFVGPADSQWTGTACSGC